MKKTLYLILILAGLASTVYFSIDVAKNGSMDEFYRFHFRNGVSEGNSEFLNPRILSNNAIKEGNYFNHEAVENNEIYIEKPMEFYICYDEFRNIHRRSFSKFSFRFINADNGAKYNSSPLPEEKTYWRIDFLNTHVNGGNKQGVVLAKIDIKTPGWYKIECAGNVKFDGRTILMANSRIPVFEGGDVLAMKIKGDLAISIVCLVVSGLFLLSVIVLFIKRRKRG